MIHHGNLKDQMQSRLITTSDGSHTIYVPELDEHYHSTFGAIQESDHIFIRSGYRKSKADPVHIFEVGFGTGLNAFMTAIECLRDNRTVYYESIEKYPLGNDVISQLNYQEFFGNEFKDIFTIIHSSSWETSNRICGNFYLKKIRADLTSFQFSEKYNLIYFDAFGPLKQPDMWTPEIFSSIASVTLKDGVFITYSARGEVKRNLEACGFKVSLLPGPPGKRQIISAIKL